MATTVAPVSFAEFEALPDHPGKLELILGEVSAMPPAFLAHVLIAHRILRELNGLSPRGGAELFGFLECGYKIGENWLIPDVSVPHPDQESAKYFEGAPMLAVEVVSESNSAEQLDRKIAIYLGSGAREVWVVYPATRSLWQYRKDGTAQRQTGPFDTAIFAGQQFPWNAIWE